MFIHIFSLSVFPVVLVQRISRPMQSPPSSVGQPTRLWRSVSKMLSWGCFAFCRTSPLPFPFLLKGGGNSINPKRCSRKSPTRQLINCGCPDVLPQFNRLQTRLAIYTIPALNFLLDCLKGVEGKRPSA